MTTNARPLKRVGATYPHVVDILRRHNHTSGVTIEIGCGGNQYAQFLQGEHIATDLPAIRYKGIPPTVFCDGRQLPFKEDCADLVYMVAVLHTVPDANVILAECHRVLRPGGTLLVFDYNHATTRRLNRARQAAHVWSCRELRRRIRKEGFTAKTIWDYRVEPRTTWKRLLERFKTVRYLRLLAEFSEGWNIVASTKKRRTRSSRD